MPSENAQQKGVWDLPERLLKGAAVLGGVVLLVILCLVTWAVFCRYVLNQPILGDKELVEIGMSLVVMLAMPFATLSGAHIRVDVLDRPLRAWGRFLGDVFARVAAAFVLYLLIGKTWDKAWDAHKYNDVTNMIEIPVWIPYTAITAGMGLYGVVLLGQLVQQFRRGVAGYE